MRRRRPSVKKPMGKRLAKGGRKRDNNKQDSNYYFFFFLKKGPQIIGVVPTGLFFFLQRQSSVLQRKQLEFLSRSSAFYGFHLMLNFPVFIQILYIFLYFCQDGGMNVIIIYRVCDIKRRQLLCVHWRYDWFSSYSSGLIFFVFKWPSSIRTQSV